MLSISASAYSESKINALAFEISQLTESVEELKAMILESKLHYHIYPTSAPYTSNADKFYRRSVKTGVKTLIRVGSTTIGRRINNSCNNVYQNAYPIYRRFSYDKQHKNKDENEDCTIGTPSIGTHFASQRFKTPIIRVIPRKPYPARSIAYHADSLNDDF